MNIFKQMYTVRRYKGTSWDSGTAETTYSDMQLPLDVQAKTRRNRCFRSFHERRSDRV